MTIRKATQSETNYILQLTGKVMKESSMGYADDDVNKGYNLFFPLIQNGAYYLVDKEKNKLRGWMLLGVDWNPLTNNPIGNLIHLYVFPAYRKAGIGKNLMQESIKEFKTLGIHTIQLNVYKGNPAKGLYEKLGFRKVSTVMELKL